MRTTLNIEDEALDKLKKYAEDRRISLGQAASDLINRGADATPRLKTKGGWALLESPKNAPPLTTEYVKQLQEELDQEDYRRAFAPRR